MDTVEIRMGIIGVPPLDKTVCISQAVQCQTLELLVFKAAELQLTAVWELKESERVQSTFSGSITR